MLNKTALDLLGPDPKGVSVGSNYSRSPTGYYPGGGAGNPYRGSARFDANLAMWSPANMSADMEILLGKYMTDARAKDAQRNDSFIQNANNIQKDSIVGSMYMLNAKPNRSALGLTDKKWDGWESAFQEEVEGLWTVAAESGDCWLDAGRSLPFTGMVRLAVGIFGSIGEVLATVEWNKDKSRPFKTCINFVDLDRLVTPPGEMDDESLRRGIYRDQFGAPTAFSICDGYPNDLLNKIGTGYTYTKVPVRTPWGREQVLYLKDPWRAEQTRGISALVSALKEWRMTKGYRDIVLQNAVTNATYAASIESEVPDEAFAALGGTGAPDVGTVINDYAGAYLSAINAYVKGAGNGLMIDGVKIPHLFPGTKLQLRPAGTPGGVGTAFEDSLLRYLAASLGLSYEQLSKNYSNTNYSSIRAAMIETWKYMQARKRLIADRFASSCYRLWFEEMFNARAFTTLPKTMPSIYIGMNLSAYTSAEWIGAARGQIDELKETQGASLRLTANLSTLEAECGRLGYDWRQVLRQRAREQTMMTDLGLPLPSTTSATNTTNALSPKPTPAGGAGAEDPNDN